MHSIFSPTQIQNAKAESYEDASNLKTWHELHVAKSGRAIIFFHWNQASETNPLSRQKKSTKLVLRQASPRGRRWWSPPEFCGRWTPPRRSWRSPRASAASAAARRAGTPAPQVSPPIPQTRSVMFTWEHLKSFYARKTSPNIHLCLFFSPEKLHRLSCAF